MRDRLSQLVCQSTNDECGKHCNLTDYCSKCEKVSDHLLANGVIVPPCKVGEKVYVADRGLGVYWRGTVVSVYYGHDETGYGISFDDGDFAAYDGRDVFRTKEEAEAALKGGAE